MDEALVRIDIGRQQRREIGHRRLLATDEVAKQRGGLPCCITEHIAPAVQGHQALMDVHGTARSVRQRLGHAHHQKAMLEPHLFK